MTRVFQIIVVMLGIVSSVTVWAAEHNQPRVVVVTLAPLDSHQLNLAPYRVSDAGKQEIASLQRWFERDMALLGWQTVYKYQTIAAIVGRIDAAGLNVLRSHPLVSASGPDQPIYATANSALPFVGVEPVGGPSNDTGEGVVVAVFDSGIDTDHPDFSGRIIVGGAFLNQGQTGDSAASIEDQYGHGTHVSGLIGAAGLVAPRGVAPQAKLLVYRVLDGLGDGWATDWAAAMDNAVTADVSGLRVSNASLSTYELFEDCPCGVSVGTPAYIKVLRDASANLEAKGVLNVTSAGNAGVKGKLPAPGCFGSSFSVGAVYHFNKSAPPLLELPANAWGNFKSCKDLVFQSDQVVCLTNIGQCLDVVAPGAHIQSAGLGGSGNHILSGTSQAAGIMSGAAALVYARDMSQTATQVRNILVKTGVQVDLPLSVGGQVSRLNVSEAVLAVSCGNGIVDDGEPCDFKDNPCCQLDCTLMPNNTGCEDGLFCSANDTCIDGVCTSGPLMDCSGQADDCNVGHCNEAMNMCEKAPLEGAIPCDDGLFCTQGDECQQGVCQPGDVLDCSDLSTACLVGQCSEQEQGCIATALPDETVCDDGLYCTKKEACIAGDCVVLDTIDCSGLTNQCNVGQCSDAESQCVSVPHNNGTLCNDGIYCTEADTCQAGDCVAGKWRLCSQFDGACTYGKCIEAEQACVSFEVGNGVPCEDGVFCTQGDTCQQGVCEPGAMATCAVLSDACNTGVCNEGAGACQLEPVVDGTVCESGQFCSAKSECQKGLCSTIEVVDCSALDGPCAYGLCDESSDQCRTVQAPNKTPCEDDSFCTELGQCQEGLCISGPVIECVDGQVCSESEQQCVPTADSTPNKGSSTTKASPGGCAVSTRTTAVPIGALVLGAVCLVLWGWRRQRS